jgi:hypothetical protein
MIKLASSINNEASSPIPPTITSCSRLRELNPKNSLVIGIVNMPIANTTMEIRIRSLTLVRGLSIEDKTQSPVMDSRMAVAV